MATDRSDPAEAARAALAELARLRRFTGPPAEFWPAFLAAAASLVGARQAVLLLRSAAAPADWKKLGQWSADGPADRFAVAFGKQLAELAGRCAEHGGFVQPVEGASGANARHFSLVAGLQLPKPDDTCVVAFLLADVSESQAREALVRLQLVADAPVSYQLQQLASQAKTDVEKFATTLDLMVQVNAEKRFVAAAFAFCNGLATRHHCDRVSLGWLEHGYVRLKTMSRTERFERNMAAVKALEIAMEEALDQDAEIVWPPAGATITRDHAAYAREQGSQFVCSVPLRLEGEVTAVLTCERQAGAFTEDELRQLRLTCDQAVRRLSDLRRMDRWFGARWMASAREQLGRLVGVEHTWAKFLTVLASIALFLVLVIKINYRVEANFVLRSDEVAYLTASFDGFIHDVEVRVSDPVKRQQPLLNLAKDELELEEAAAVADLARFTREAEKARAGNALAEMRVSVALADQARARLDLTRYRLSQATVRAPFDGVITEGDQRERVGAPVKQGEVLFKVAKTEALYVEADVSEKDIHEIQTGVAGEVAFASQPKLKFPIRLIRVQAAAESKESGNVFPVRCAFVDPPQGWWRPGMSGVSKINVGKRRLIWVLTHRTIDYLRLLLWW
ncbi:MAG: HlyD family efflux transporter periplasmic adaptor subunit [Limisphaerales bacterium]